MAHFREDWFEERGSNRHEASRPEPTRNYSAIKEEQSLKWERSEVKVYDRQEPAMSEASASGGPEGEVKHSKEQMCI